ncbi:unnamed protein product [Ambrosiozyma monospora]|uniref:Unnamed protein product n=1 Tax=Ambrosiozyma monospora TaxID=43982 RepID=A0ACB5TAX4_AMBMO|nr:unnamed protein product [Ambrosiozyma monospora]
MALIFGTPRMKKCAKIHGLGFECNLPHADKRGSLANLVYNALSIDAKEGDTFGADSPAYELLLAFDRDGKFAKTKLGLKYFEAFEFLDKCLALDYRKRISAEEALKMKFLRKRDDKKKMTHGDVNDDDEDVIIN